MSIEGSLERIAEMLEILVDKANAMTAPPATCAVTEGKKRGRPAKVEKEPEPVKEEVEEVTDFLDEKPDPILMKEDIKNALIKAQERLTAKYADAQKGLNEAMYILKKAGGVDRLGQLPENQRTFKAIIDAANAAQ